MSFWALAASRGERYGNYNKSLLSGLGEAGCACWPQQDSGSLRSRCSRGAEAGHQGQVTGAGPWPGAGSTPDSCQGCDPAPEGSRCLLTDFKCEALKELELDFKTDAEQA